MQAVLWDSNYPVTVNPSTYVYYGDRLHHSQLIRVGMVMNKIIPTMIDYTAAFDVNTFDSSNVVMTPLIALSANL